VRDVFNRVRARRTAEFMPIGAMGAKRNSRSPGHAQACCFFAFALDGENASAKLKSAAVGAKAA
jgi:hypothetical protein